MIGWALALAVLLIPAIAMQFTHEVNWGPGDFATAAVLLGSLVLGIDLALTRLRGRALRFAGAAAVTGAVLLIWAELAVGLFH